MDGNDSNLIAVFLRNLLEVRKFLDAGAAPGSPEIDNGQLAGFGGVNGFAGITAAADDGQVSTVAQITYGSA